VGTCALASPLPSLAVINVTSQSALGFALLSLSCYFTTYREKLQIFDTSFVLHLLISRKIRQPTRYCKVEDAISGGSGDRHVTLIIGKARQRTWQRISTHPFSTSYCRSNDFN